MTTEVSAAAIAESPVSPAKEPLSTRSTTSVTTASTDDSLSDAERIRLADSHYADSEFIRASQHLQSVKDEALLTPEYRRIIDLANKAELTKKELLSLHPENEGWTKQQEVHGHRDTALYYKVNPDTSILCRIETPIEQSLLVPLVSVMNESELYATWMPSWRVPRLGIKRSEKLAELGRGHQIIDVELYLPFPFSNRQCIQHAWAVDTIEDDNAIIIRDQSVDTGEHFGLKIPPPKKGVTRVDFDAGFYIRACPDDHPLLQNSRADYGGEEKLLLSVTQVMDAHVSLVPQGLINFFTRTVLGRLWGSLLQVAEEVRDGKRPDHSTAIDGKPELYDWVQKRIEYMFEKIEKEKLEALMDE